MAELVIKMKKKLQYTIQVKALLLCITLALMADSVTSIPFLKITNLTIDCHDITNGTDTNYCIDDIGNSTTIYYNITTNQTIYINSSINLFDQDLNTTSNVSFNSIRYGNNTNYCQSTLSGITCTDENSESWLILNHADSYIEADTDGLFNGNYANWEITPTQIYWYIDNESSYAQLQIEQNKFFAETSGDTGFSTIALLNNNIILQSDGYFSIDSNEGISQTITTLKDINFTSQTKAFCNTTFYKGIVINTDC